MSTRRGTPSGAPRSAYDSNDQATTCRHTHASVSLGTTQCNQIVWPCCNGHKKSYRGGKDRSETSLMMAGNAHHEGSPVVSDELADKDVAEAPLVRCARQQGCQREPKCQEQAPETVHQIPCRLPRRSSVRKVHKLSSLAKPCLKPHILTNIGHLISVFGNRASHAASLATAKS